MATFQRLGYWKFWPSMQPEWSRSFICLWFYRELRTVGCCLPGKSCYLLLPRVYAQPSRYTGGICISRQKSYCSGDYSIAINWNRSWRRRQTLKETEKRTGAGSIASILMLGCRTCQLINFSLLDQSLYGDGVGTYDCRKLVSYILRCTSSTYVIHLVNKLFLVVVPMQWSFLLVPIANFKVWTKLYSFYLDIQQTRQ